MTAPTHRRPVSASASSVLPTLAALSLAGALAQGCIAEAQAQTPPADAGVRRPHPPTPPPVPNPPPPPNGGMARVHTISDLPPSHVR